MLGFFLGILFCHKTLLPARADPLGIPAAFGYLLLRQGSHLNPPVNPSDDQQAVVSAKVVVKVAPSGAGVVIASALRGFRSILEYFVRFLSISCDS